MHSFFWEIPVFNWCCCELALYIFHLAAFLKFGPNGPFGPLGCPKYCIPGLFGWKSNEWLRMLVYSIKLLSNLNERRIGWEKKLGSTFTAEQSNTDRNKPQLQSDNGSCEHKYWLPSVSEKNEYFSWAATEINLSRTKNPGLTSQRHSALISSDSEYFQVCFSAVHYLKISEQRWFSSEQRWKRKFSELKISAETALFSSETELIQSWTALIFSETALKLEIFRAKNSALNQSCFSADFLWNRADFLWNSAETPKFQSKKISAESELFQRWFSLKQSWTADFLWHSAEKKTKIQSKKNQLWISAVSALIFPERELIPTEAFLNSSHHSWFSPETTLNIPRHLILFPQTSAGKLRS